MDLTSGVDTSYLGVDIKDDCLDWIHAGTEKIEELAQQTHLSEPFTT